MSVPSLPWVLSDWNNRKQNIRFFCRSICWYDLLFIHHIMTRLFVTLTADKSYGVTIQKKLLRQNFRLLITCISAKFDFVFWPKTGTLSQVRSLKFCRLIPAICSWFVATDDNNELGLKLERTTILMLCLQKLPPTNLLWQDPMGCWL